MKQKVIRLFMTGLVTMSILGGSVPAFADNAADSSDKNSGDYVYQDLDDAEITFFNFSVEYKDLYEQEIAAYNEIHPNITINMDLIGGSDWRTTLKAEISSGQAPTIMALEGASDLASFSDYLEDLSDQPWVEHIYDSVIEDCKMDDKVIGLPSALVSYGLLYNTEIFEACGIDGSTLKTYDAIDDAFATIQEKIDNGDLKDQFPELEAVVSLPAAETWVLANHGANAFLGTEFGSSMNAYNSDTVDFTYADAYKDYIDLLVKYSPDADNPSALVAVDYDSAMGGSFCIGKTAVIQMGQWVYSTIGEIDEDLQTKLGVLPIPVKGTDEDNICYGVGGYDVVNSQATDAEKAAAKDFLNWLYMSDEGKAFVITNSAVPMDNYEDFPVANAISTACDVYAQEGNTIPLVFGSCPDGWLDLLGSGVQSYIAGDKSWDEVIDEAKTQWSELR